MTEAEATLAFQAYFEAMEPYEIGEIRRAVDAAIREPGRVFLPTPGELIEYVLHERRERRLRRESETRALPAVREPSPEELADVKRLLADLEAKFKV